MRDFSIDLVWAKLQMAIAAVGGWLGYFVGGVDGLMTALLVLMVMDYVTGVMCAVIDRELSSSMGFRGIFKKVLILMLVGVAHIVDLHVVRSGEALRSAVICFYLSNHYWFCLYPHIAFNIKLIFQKMWHSRPRQNRQNNRRYNPVHNYAAK